MNDDELVKRLRSCAFTGVSNQQVVYVDKSALEQAAAAIEALERDTKAHEKEIAVWSENYAAMERKLEAAHADTKKVVEALREALYFLGPTESDMEKKAGIYRIVTTLAEIEEATGMSDDLKPCPFCGEAQPPHDDTSWVRCLGCGAETGWRPTGDEAIAAWNTRTPDTSIEALTKERDEAMQLLQTLSNMNGDLSRDMYKTKLLLAKALEALRLIEADCEADYPPSHLAIKYAARATLAEIEGEKG